MYNKTLELDAYIQHKKLPVVDRRKFLMRNKLCFDERPQ